MAFLDRFTRLGAMLSHRGAAAPAQPDGELLRAVQRCLACEHTCECDAFLGARARGAWGVLCPNTGYIERLRRSTRA